MLEPKYPLLEKNKANFPPDPAAQIARSCPGRFAGKSLFASKEEAYLGWIRRFILFNGKKHPGEMGASEVEIYLTHLAVDERVSTSTQKQALNALAFLYHKVMQKPLG